MKFLFQIWVPCGINVAVKKNASAQFMVGPHLLDTIHSTTEQESKILVFWNLTALFHIHIKWIENNKRKEQALVTFSMI